MNGHVEYLRAMSVVAVILYHLKLIPMGWVGVDIFFVITGFLVGSRVILMAEASTFRLRDFLRSRFRRLSPALGFSIACTVLASAVFSSHTTVFEQVLPTALGGVFSIANAELFLSSGSYFGNDAEANPLLHLWSLSAEWQVYVALGLLAFTLNYWKLNSSLRLLVGVLSLASFVIFLASFSTLNVGQFAFSYYSPFIRFWEFGAGIFAALVGSTPSPASRFLSAGLAFMGGLAIQGEWQDSGLQVILVVAGVAAFLLFSKDLNTSRISSLVRLISSRAYSLYLVHWPIIVFIGEGQVVLVVLLVLLFAEVSYRQFEPTRERRASR